MRRIRERHRLYAGDGISGYAGQQGTVGPNGRRTGLSSGAELCRGGTDAGAGAQDRAGAGGKTALHGQYPAVIATHLNTRCLHNHIVWDSVAMDTGRKYRSSARTYYTGVRALSRTGCAGSTGLSVIDTARSRSVDFPCSYGRMDGRASRGQPTWRTAIRQDVDERHWRAVKEQW